MSADKENEQVLFAVHTVQLGFATPTQVAAAAQQAWAGKKTTIADVLVGSGILSTQQRMAVERRIDREATDGSETLSANPSHKQRPIPSEGPPTVEFGSGHESTLAEPPSIDPGGLDDDVDDQVSLAQAGRYTVQGRHAAGGQARIMLAIDEHIGREVAIKELFPDEGTMDSIQTAASQQCSTPGMVRFLREARVTGQLEHPNIVPVHEVGLREDGTYYYTMRFVRGDTLAHKLKACHTLDERMTLLSAFHDVCNAISFAHSRGVVHRDIKPENIMVGEFGETVVIDWGVAKVEGKKDLRAYDIEKELRFLRQQDSGKTAAGTAIGTPSYMSPEQAKGDIDAIDERSDVWGLGAVLYELLTGKPPYTGETPMDIILQVGQDDLVPVREMCPSAPRELCAVAEKALQKKRAQRYQKSKELTDEIQAYTTGRRVDAYEYSSWELLKRFAAQNKGTIIAVVLILSVIVGALISVSMSLSAETSARAAEHQALKRAEAARNMERVERRMASFHLAQALTEKTDRMMSELNSLSATVFAAASLVHNPAHPKSSHYDAEFASRFPDSRELWVQAASRIYRLGFSGSAALKQIWHADEVLTRLAFKPDGRFLAAASLDQTVRIWSLTDQTAAPMVLEGHEDEVYGLAYSADGRLLASSAGDGTILIRRPPGKIIKRIQAGKARVNVLDFSPEGKHLAAACWDGKLRIFDSADGKQISEIKAHPGKVNSVAYSPDGQTLASVGSDNLVRLWNRESLKPGRVLSGAADELYTVSFSPDGQFLAAAGNGRIVRVWSLATGRMTLKLEGHTDGILNLSFSPDGQTILSASYDKTVRSWNLKRGTLMMTIGGHKNFVTDAVYSPDGRTLATGSYDRSARLWQLVNGRPLQVLRGHRGNIYGLAHSPDGRWLASGSWDKTLRIWDTRTGKVNKVMHGHKDIIDALTFSADSRLIATAGRDNTARVWSLAKGRQVRVLPHPSEVPGVEFSPDGKFLASACDDKLVRIWNVASGKLDRTLTGHTEEVNNLAYSPDGKLLASVGRDRQIRLHNPDSGELVKTMTGHSDWISGVDFSPDGQHLITAAKDGLAMVWDLNKGQVEARLAGHDQWVNTVRYSSDGKLLASASDDKTVRIWSAEDGRPLMIIAAEVEVVAMDFSPDNKFLAIGDGSQLKRYPLDFTVLEESPSLLLKKAERTAGMNLEGFELKVCDELH